MGVLIQGVVPEVFRVLLVGGEMAIPSKERGVVISGDESMGFTIQQGPETRQTEPRLVME